MSKLTLVRHGQGADGLTSLGEAQARKLGEFLAGRGVQFDQAVVGSLARQHETAEAVAEAYTSRSLPFPALREDAGWDEYEAGPIMTVFGSQLEDSDPEHAKLAQSLRDAAGGPDEGRHFQRRFEAIMTAWTEATSLPDGVQAFDEFHRGVIAARDRVMDGSGGRSVIVFTSGGPIGANVGASVGAPPAQTVRINWRVHNASITEFTFSRQRLALDSFNGLPHLLDARELVTYR